MSQASEFLSSPQPRARWMRFDTAQLLKRFFFCERSLLVSEAAWIPAIAPLDIKTGLARFIWQSAETADALRNRVFELRFPSRLLEEQGADHALIELFSAVKDSPSVPAFLLSIGKVLLPALRDSYREYLEASDSIADGPTHRFLSLALSEKTEQISAFEQWAESALADESRAARERAGLDTGGRETTLGRRRSRSRAVLIGRRRRSFAGSKDLRHSRPARARLALLALPLLLAGRGRSHLSLRRRNATATSLGHQPPERSLGH